MLDVMRLAKLMTRLDGQSVRVIVVGGVMPMFSQAVHREATTVRECVISRDLFFDIGEWSEALISAWAKEQLSKCPLRPVWTKDECERAANGLPVTNLDTRQLIDAH